jgi:hypothetical protein
VAPLQRLLGVPATTADRWAFAIVFALPALINLPFALAGCPLMGGDNLDQNFPLRVLSGELIAHGRLPLWNPDIWSGTALLAGWNAGAMYPGTWLFAVLPGVAAWEINVISVGVVGGIGLLVFLRRQGCSAVVSLLGALTFSYTGFMSGQEVHIGLVTGMAFAPWMLVALDAMARARTVQERLGPIALLGASGGLVVLAGDPRAISNDAIVAGAYLVALCWRQRHSPEQRTWQLLAAALTSGALCLALSAVQWLPGLSFLHESQRASASLAAFGAYSLSGGQLAYLLAPFVFGGNGTLGLPTTNFNLPEFTYSVGILPLVAVLVLATRGLLRHAACVSHRREDRALRDIASAPRDSLLGPPVGVFLVLFVLGIALSLGTTTPLGHLLVRIPLYGGERLQNRNMGITDLALSVLVAVFIDQLAAPARTKGQLVRGSGEDPVPQPGTGPLSQERELTLPERIAGMIPPVMVLALVVAMFSATAATERFLGANVLALGLPVRMAPYYAFELVVAAAALAVVVRRRWRKPGLRRLVALSVVSADLAMFIVMSSYQPAPSAALATSNAAVTGLLKAAGETTGRDAIFNPQQLEVASGDDTIDDLGLDDLVVLHHLASVQGYGSAVASSYEDATGAHEVENLRPSALVTATFDILNLRLLATLPELFGTVQHSAGDLALPKGPPRPPGTSPADRQSGNTVDFSALPPAGPWSLSSSGRTVFELPGPLAIDQVAVRLRASAGGPVPATTKLEVTVLLRSGARRQSTLLFSGLLGTLPVSPRAVSAGGGALEVEISLPPTTSTSAKKVSEILEAVAVHVVPWADAVPISSALAPKSPVWFQLDGMLQGLLAPSTWSYHGHEGPVLFYRNLKADGQAWLEPLGSQTVTSTRAAGTVTQPTRAEWQDPVDYVTAPKGALLVRSESYAPGWSATVVPAGHRKTAAAPGAVAVSVPVRPVALVQGVTLPPGRWVVTWRYRSSRAEVGLVAGFIGFLALLALLAGASGRPVRRKKAGRARAGLRRTRTSGDSQV